MPHSHSRLSFLITVFVFVLSVAAVPWTTNDKARILSEAQRYSYKKAADLEPKGVQFPRLTWLRDSVVEKVFRLPGAAKTAQNPDVFLQSHTSNPELPATLLARYGGDVVLRFNLSSAAEEQALSEAADTLFLDVWEATGNWADIRMREDDVPSLLGLLPKSLQKAYSPLMPDLAKSIYESYPSMAWSQMPHTSKDQQQSFSPALRTGAVHSSENIFFQNYQPLSVIVPWMRLMASMFTTHVRMISIGTSYEGRDIQGLRIGVSPNLPSDENKPRKTILISGGSHAREWISVSTVTYIAWSLITLYGKTPAITKLLQEFDFVLIPTLNVDGYVYTWETDRLWRKNRQQTNLRFCQGLDLDRGYGFEWGSSFDTNPCSESYPGDEPFQAVESHRFAEWAKNETENNNVQFVGFLDLHSYSQQVLYPYSYSCSANPPSLENLEELGIGLAKAVRLSSGEQYSVNSACEGAVSAKKSGSASASRMETGGGSAIDWFYHELKVRYSYQIKLRDLGSYGFLLPKENIVPTGEEAFDAVKYFGDFLLGNKGIERKTVEEIKEEFVGAMKEEVEIGAVEEVEEYEEFDAYQWELRRKRR